jgi:tRNA(Ile2) C34 agmatinyltransferase TiaS
MTLVQLLTRAHEDVSAYGTAVCPVCGGVMEHAGAQAACASCGSRLS